MTYPTEATAGARISAVEPHGAAARCGLRAGETIATADGQSVRDVIDWMWIADSDSVRLVLEPAAGRDAREVTLRRSLGEGWGLTFDGVVFDGVRQCDNACAFCFVAQLPPGMRPSLRVRDDDFRLSFLAGNFITLTNLSDADMDRIVEQRLSPLYVSLHAVDPDVRRALLCPTIDDEALARFDELAAAGIETHVQVVLVRGLNDGPVLERTLGWLARREGVLSVGLVPVGVTRYQRRRLSTFASAGDARAVLDQIAPWRTRMFDERGEHWVHAADEFHLLAGGELPAAADYDGFPQFENGIGMVRAFIDELAEEVAGGPEAGQTSRPGGRAVNVVLVSGEFFAPVLGRLTSSLDVFGVTVRVLCVANALLGGNVGVAGLLAGTDIASAIARDRAALPRGSAPATYLVPDLATNDEGLFMDDLRLQDVVEQAGADVRLVSSDAAGLAAALVSLTSHTTGG